MGVSTKKIKPINLALQGGGAHGAFTWGVLDYILQCDDIEIESLSGTSAGAVNAAVLISGFESGGRVGAREALKKFWASVSRPEFHKTINQALPKAIRSDWSLDKSPFFLWFDLVSRISSPYQLNPLNINPLKTILEESINFKLINHCTKIKLFISATNVETGQAKVFHNQDVNVDVMLASTCLPLLFQAVEIDNTPYWDGGYIGNPVLYPVFYECDSSDLLVVKINPFKRVGTPTTSREILNRIDEINFNSSLIKDLRSIRFVQRLLVENKVNPEDYKHMLIHVIDGDDYLVPLSASSKFNTEKQFIDFLHQAGLKVAEQWFDDNRKSLGKKSSFDLDALFEVKA